MLSAPTPEDILRLSSKKLYNIVNKASKGRFKQDFVTNLIATAKGSFGIKFSTSACAFEIKQLINQIVFIENQISDLEIEIYKIYKELYSFLTTIPGIGDTLKRGSPYLHHALFTAAFVAMNNDKHLRDFYDRKKAESKHHFVAIARVQRKLLGIIGFVLKEQKPYIPYN